MHWENGKFTRLSEADGLVNNEVRCLLQGADGALWIGSEGGLTRYKDGRFANFAERTAWRLTPSEGYAWIPMGTFALRR